MVFSRIFRKTRKWKVFLTGRGRKQLVGEVEAKDYRDLHQTVMRMINDLAERAEDGERVPADPRKFPRILCEDENGNRYRFRNPAYDEEIEERESKKKEDVETQIEKIVIMSVAEKIPGIVSKAFDISFKVSDRLIESAMGVIRKYSSPSELPAGAKSAFEDLRAVAETVNAFVNLAKNWDKVKKVMKEADVKKLLRELGEKK